MTINNCKRTSYIHFLDGMETIHLRDFSVCVSDSFDAKNLDLF